MRADRLVATLLLMQARGRVTAAELAAEFEVSVATARRDLEALSAAGIPVYPQPGRGGGWSLVGGARTNLSGLTAGEARALFLLLGPATSGSATSGSALVGSALRKLIQALPQTFRAEAEAAAGAVRVDPTGWGERRRDAGSGSDLVEVLQLAVAGGRRVRLRHLSRSGEQTERLVDPWRTVSKDGVWYLLAGTDRGRRTFRVDRIVAAEATELDADRPGEDEVSAAWEQTVVEVERHRSLQTATLLTRPRFAAVLHDQFGRHCEVGDHLDDGRVRVRVAAHSARSLAEQLAGWGAMVDVIEPAEVQRELARIGAELMARYATSGS
jgi:predicted DNA-binding transcriptional regulator YafY